jgi:hypothetical protein
LTRLTEIDPRKARIVAMRFFAGLSIQETALVLSHGHGFAFISANKEKETDRSPTRLYFLRSQFGSCFDRHARAFFWRRQIQKLN